MFQSLVEQYFELVLQVNCLCNSVAVRWGLGLGWNDFAVCCSFANLLFHNSPLQISSFANKPLRNSPKKICSFAILLLHSSPLSKFSSFANLLLCNSPPSQLSSFATLLLRKSAPSQIAHREIGMRSQLRAPPESSA